MFVGSRPVQTRTIPSTRDKGQTFDYGDHLVQFLSGKTGLKSDTKKSVWGKIVWELMEKKIAAGTNIQGVLDHFNSFESHEIWSIDQGPCESGFGVQLMIVWDGELVDDQSQVQSTPKIPVLNILPEGPTTVEEEGETFEFEQEADLLATES